MSPSSHSEQSAQATPLPSPQLWTVLNLPVRLSFTTTTIYRIHLGISEVREIDEMGGNRNRHTDCLEDLRLKEEDKKPTEIHTNNNKSWINNSLSQPFMWIFLKKQGYFVKIISMLSDGCPAKNIASTQKRRRVLEIAPFGLHRCVSSS